MERSETEPSPRGRCVVLQPTSQPRGPPRAVHDFGEVDLTSHGYILEVPLDRRLEQIRLYFISANDLDEPVQDCQLHNPCGVNFVSSSMNKYLPKEERNVCHWNQYHILLPEQPPFIERSDSKVVISIGPGGMPFQYEVEGPYTCIRPHDDKTIEFEPPTKGTICVILKLEIHSKRNASLTQPSTVPGLKVCNTPENEDILDAVRIEISQQGYPNYVSLHVRLVTPQNAEGDGAGQVQPHLFNTTSVNLLDTMEIDSVLSDETCVYHNYSVRLNILRPPTMFICMKGGAKPWKHSPVPLCE
ncbi:hypothetical protein BGZ63DRAFT_400743 [Mariannaea sp. PMI_226]|nr:hypothetical protein BGZ63DRAFT_400743 [Mariannaea sp. PMI_226]